VNGADTHTNDSTPGGPDAFGQPVLKFGFVWSYPAEVDIGREHSIEVDRSPASHAGS
jgi:hypothetical protein